LRLNKSFAAVNSTTTASKMTIVAVNQGRVTLKNDGLTGQTMGQWG